MKPTLIHGRTDCCWSWKIPILWPCDAMGQLIRTHQVPLSMGILQAKHWSWLLGHPLWDLLNPGIEPRSPTLLADSLLSELPGKPTMYLTNANNYKEWKPGFSLLEKGFTHIEIKDQILCCSGIEGLVWICSFSHRDRNAREISVIEVEGIPSLLKSEWLISETGKEYNGPQSQ